MVWPSPSGGLPSLGGQGSSFRRRGGARHLRRRHVSRWGSRGQPCFRPTSSIKSLLVQLSIMVSVRNICTETNGGCHFRGILKAVGPPIASGLRGRAAEPRSTGENETASAGEATYRIGLATRSSRSPPRHLDTRQRVTRRPAASRSQGAPREIHFECCDRRPPGSLSN